MRLTRAEMEDLALTGRTLATATAMEILRQQGECQTWTTATSLHGTDDVADSTYYD